GGGAMGSITPAGSIIGRCWELNRLHLGQVVADGFWAAADAGVVAGKGLRDLGEVQRQRLHWRFTAATQRVMAEADVFEFESQEFLYLTLGRRGEADRDFIVHFAGNRVEKELGAGDVLELCHRDFAQVRLAVLSRRRAPRRRSDMAARSPLEGIELDPVLVAVGR